MKTKHTPGPWEVQKLNHASGELWLQIGCQRNGASWGPIAELKYLIATDSQQWADARLIAVAPELLEALKWLLPLAESYLKHAPSSPDNAKLESARAAIAKAEGEDQ